MPFVHLCHYSFSYLVRYVVQKGIRRKCLMSVFRRAEQKTQPGVEKNGMVFMNGCHYFDRMMN